MKRYVIMSLKVVVLLTSIVLSFSVKPGYSIVLGFLAGYISFAWLLQGDVLVFGYKTIHGNWVNTYKWSSAFKKRRAYRVAYLFNVLLFLFIFSYGTISNHIEDTKTKASIERYMRYTESDAYKQKQEAFKMQFNAMKERARI